MKKIISVKTVLVGSLALVFCLGMYFSKTLQSSFLPRNNVTSHSTIVGGGIPEYSKMADAIVIGVVEEVGQPYWQETQDEQHDLIQRDATIRVEEILKGETNIIDLTLVLQGGTIGDTSVLAENEAKFKQGEKVLLFIGTNSEGDNVVFAGSSGKYLINQEETEVTSTGNIKMPLDKLIEQIEVSLR